MKQMNLRNDDDDVGTICLYVYAVFKIILFKFSSIDITFLWHQLQMNLGNPVHIKMDCNLRILLRSNLFPIIFIVILVMI